MVIIRACLLLLLYQSYLNCDALPLNPLDPLNLSGIFNLNQQGSPVINPNPQIIPGLNLSGLLIPNLQGLPLLNLSGLFNPNGQGVPGLNLPGLPNLLSGLPTLPPLNILGRGATPPGIFDRRILCFPGVCRLVQLLNPDCRTITECEAGFTLQKSLCGCCDRCLNLGESQ